MGKTLTDMAKTITRSRMGIRTPRNQPIVEVRPRPTPEPVAPPPTPSVYTTTPDSWDPRFRPTEPTPPPREDSPQKIQVKGEADLKKVPEILITEQGYETRTALRMKSNKLRKTCMSLSLSEEEARIVRNHVASLNTNFSTWARNTLFRAIGKPIPARPKKVV